MDNNQPSNKLKTARTLKWNTIDKLSSQLLYAVTGIVLANTLSKADFGLVGAILVFQAFAALFVDSGFSNALVQRKKPTEVDYSTVFYFNLAMSIGIYAVLWVCAPLIDSLFHAGGRLIPLSRVMFLTFIINASAIVQTNRLVKQMNVKFVAMSNVAGLVVSGAVGIYLAVTGWGAWAIVWQSIALASVKSIMLWCTTKWRPMLTFSMASLKSIFSVGAGVMVSSTLNTIFLYIYSFIIGTKYALEALGSYTQADKWSKMGIASLSQILNTTFLPLLSDCQDDKARFHKMLGKVNRLSSYLIFPCLGLLTVTAPAIFHVLFGTKWDEAVPLFQLLAIRGIFTVLTSNYNNYILAVGDAKRLVSSEVVKDLVIVACIIVTLPLGVTWLVIGQVVAGVVCYLYSLWLVRKSTGYAIGRLVADAAPYVGISAIACLAAWCAGYASECAWVVLPLQLALGAGMYLLFNMVFHSTIQDEVLEYALGRFRKKK